MRPPFLLVYRKVEYIDSSKVNQPTLQVTVSADILGSLAGILLLTQHRNIMCKHYPICFSLQI